MSNPLGRRATQELTRIGLVLSHRHARRDWLGRCTLTVAAGLVGVATGYVSWGEPLGHLQQQAATVQDQQQLQQRLEQSRLTLRMSEARGQELERQIAALIQQLRESQEELTFFRKARDHQR
jgi:hypothetical protein